MFLADIRALKREFHHKFQADQPSMNMLAYAVHIPLVQTKTKTLQMNVYRCCYQGIQGFGCRLRACSWLFVPDLHQQDGTIYKGIKLGDLDFQNRHEQEHELHHEELLARRSLISIFLSALFSHNQALTTAGRLLTPRHNW